MSTPRSSPSRRCRNDSPNSVTSMPASTRPSSPSTRCSSGRTATSTPVRPTPASRITRKSDSTRLTPTSSGYALAPWPARWMTTRGGVLPPKPYESLSEYVEAGGGAGLAAAGAVEPTAIIEELAASGLRGRGGAGFPTGEKWRTIKSFESSVLRTSVVVNAAEGEPGTFKDRTILRANPYEVHRGRADRGRRGRRRPVIIATKAGSRRRSPGFAAAIAEMHGRRLARRCRGRSSFEGPRSTSTARRRRCSRSLDGRPPFPRIAPPYRRGVDEVVEPAMPTPDSDSGLSPTSRWPGTDDDAAAARARRQRRDAGQRPEDHRQRAPDWFRTEWHRRIARHDRVHGHRRRRPAPASARCRWARRCARSSSSIGGGAGPRALDQGGARRRVQHGR